MAASFTDKYLSFLSNALPHRGGASVEKEGVQPSEANTVISRTNSESEHDEARTKRPRASKPSSHDPEAVISLVDSDEEDDNPIMQAKRPRSRVRHIPKSHQHGQGAVFNSYSSNAAFPSLPGQTVGRVDGAGFTRTRDGGDYRGVGEDYASSNVGSSQQAQPAAAEPGFTIPGAFPALDGPELQSLSQLSQLSQSSRGSEYQEPHRIQPRTVEPQLCPEQAELVDIILSGRNVFYTGSAGCGKSTVLKAFTRRLRDRGLKVDIVAPTGISALGVGGSTTFVYAGWSLSSFRQPLEDVRRGAHRKYVRNRLKETDVLVIDEISMVENFHFERLNAVMQAARSSYDPFGGVQVIVTGDFHQLPPVKPFEYCLHCGEELVPNRSEDYVSCPKHGIFHDEDKWAFKSEVWGLCDFAYFHLTTIHRQNDETFIKILQKCRIGQPLTADDTDLLMNHPCKTGNATKLYARREEVRKENQKRFDKLLSEKFSYMCMDDFYLNPSHPHLERHGRRSHNGSLDSLKDHRFETLVEFKKGMLVVLLTNLDLGRKLCNGSQGVICGYEEFDLKKLPRIATKKEPLPENTVHGDYGELRERSIRLFIERQEITKKFWPVVRFHNGEVRTIYADCSVHPLGNKEPYSLLSRTQIPLAPAWAMSIHKSQSLTLDRVIVDLTRAWEEGQVYVALSRATSLCGLKVEGDPRGLTVGKGGNSEVRKFHRDKFGIGG
ncbi:putative ATP-dependent DNA helicase pif1 [Rosellinia necatrix]|uniref:ATP-dependent DNA helicase n=1 Tax=Rosellinia necatrix TaxID=77044 RepID=A0A1S7UNQ0_ROSNE|nr:putative ATP-dependent DNA helicase pif1 [Rosellinia necatrix]